MDIPTPNPSHTDPAVPNVTREQALGAPVLGVSAASLDLDALPGGESFARKVTISNSGSGVLAWRASASPSWLKVDRQQGVANGADLGLVSQDVSFYANASGLSPGTYTTEVVIESLYALSVPQTISVTLSVSLQAGEIVAGDFSGDGKTDLVFPCCTDYASLWTSNGAGSFTASTFRPWPGYGMTLGSWQVGDLNGDQKTDLIHLCCDRSANLWLSRGDGNFDVRSFTPWPGYWMYAGTWHVGDFNGDGNTDLLHRCCHYVHIWRSDGTGSFAVDTFRP
jgi:hypothetical protein